MVVVYHCDGRLKSSLAVARARVTGTDKENIDWRLLRRQVRPVPFHEGDLKFVGCDKAGNAIYALNRRRFGKLFERVLSGVSSLAGIEVLCIDADQERRSAGKVVRELEGRSVAILKSWSKPNSPLVFYCCYGGTHTSVVAASIHAGIISARRPGWREIARLPWFDELPHRCVGIPLFIGTGPGGEKVYALGVMGARKEVLEPVRALLGNHSVGGLIQFIDVSWCTSRLVKVGGILSRRLGVVGIGRRLAASGIRASFDCIVSTVRHAQSKV